MPVVTVYYDRLLSLMKGRVRTGELLEKVPYLGLELEEVASDHARIEYNPNRPDFSTDYGIARALNGFLGFEKGAPIYHLAKGKVKVIVDRSVEGIRPYIAGLLAKGLRLDDEAIRQIIAMQEDLHHGVGRGRSKASIGIHNLDVLKAPLYYTASNPEFRFTPLGEKGEMSMREVLEHTDAGRTYGWIVKGFRLYPLLKDSRGGVLAFPPIINGELTRVTSSTRNIFVDITATDLKAAEEALSVISATLHDAGARLEKVEVIYPAHRIVTPNISAFKMEVDVNMARGLLGLSLSEPKVAESLERSRITVEIKGKSLMAVIPRYRIDILHQVDLAEEIAIGYGLHRFTPNMPKSSSVGERDRRLAALDTVREALIGLGLIEVMNFSLVNRRALYEDTNRKPPSILKVDNPKTKEHEVLRDFLIPSLLNTLSRNLHEEYPQRIFEIAKVFLRDKNGIREEYHAAASFAHVGAGYTEAKSYMASFLSQAFGLQCRTKPMVHPTFALGRVAEARSNRTKLGVVGEINPSALERFQLRTPVSAFEVNLERVI